MSFNKNLDQLYRSVIMDHYKNPRNKGSLDENSVTIDMNNPTCGDRIHLTLKLEDGVVQDAKFDGEGCSISMSSASMMTQIVKGKKLEEALQGSDLDAIKSAKSELEKAAQSIAVKAYEKIQKEQQAKEAGQNTEQNSSNDDNTVNADFEEVK